MAYCIMRVEKRKRASLYGLQAFVEWEREWRSYTIKRGLQEKKERAASTAALFILFRLPFPSWSTRFRFGSYLPAIAEVGVFVTGEINK